MNRIHIAWRQFGRRIRSRFLTGLLVLVPIGITVLIVVWIFTTIDNILQPTIRTILGYTVPGLGFVITVILIYLAGLIAGNVGGKRLIHYGESLLARVPLIRQLYNGIKQIMESFSEPAKAGFMQAVLIEFPRKGIWTLGFITRELLLESGEKQLNVFIPTAPNPMSGFLQIVKDKEVIRTDVPVDEALRMIISAGKVSPQAISDKLANRSE